MTTDASGTYCLFRKKLLEGLKPSVKLVYTYLLFYSNHTTHQCYPGIRLLANEIGYDKNTIDSSIKELESIGFIKIKHGKRGQKSIYTIINPNILLNKVYENPAHSNGKSVLKSGTLNKIKVYENPVHFPKKCMKSLHKVYENPVQNQKKEPEVKETTTTEPTVPRPRPKKSSSSFSEDGLNIPIAWNKLNCEPLAYIGFTKKYLYQIANAQPDFLEECQESINTFAELLKHESFLNSIKTTPLNCFMGKSLKGEAFLFSGKNIKKLGKEISMANEIENKKNHKASYLNRMAAYGLKLIST